MHAPVFLKLKIVNHYLFYYFEFPLSICKIHKKRLKNRTSHLSFLSKKIYSKSFLWYVLNWKLLDILAEENFLGSVTIFWGPRFETWFESKTRNKENLAGLSLNFLLEQNFRG